MQKKFLWLVIGLVISCVASYGQDTLPRRTLDFYLEQGLINSPLLKENSNAITLNRLDSLLNIAINKPYVQAIGQYLYAPAGANWGYDQSTTNGGQYTGLDSGEPEPALSPESADSEQPERGPARFAGQYHPDQPE